MSIEKATRAPACCEHPVPMTVATTDGRTAWAFQVFERASVTVALFGTRMDALKALHPEGPELAALSDESRVIVSEPLGDLPGVEVEAGNFSPDLDGVRAAAESLSPGTGEAAWEGCADAVSGTPISGSGIDPPDG
jgi:glutamine amidotransferase